MDLISEDEFLQRALQVPMQTLSWDFARRKGVEVIVRRDDLMDSHVSGNKFYKLYYNLQQAKAHGFQQLLSFGGAYSNHIYALAAAGNKFGFKTIGIIRGERPKHLSPTLQDAEQWGMQLHFVSRAEYKDFSRQASLEVRPEDQELKRKYGDFYSIPEGGANSLGLQGATVIGWAIEQHYKSDYTAVCLACGTGNTLAGVAAGIAAGIAAPHTMKSGLLELKMDVVRASKVIGFSVLKGEGNLGQRIVVEQQMLGLSSHNWRLISGFHAGGYGKKLPAELQEFNTAFERETMLQLDPVYTLKMCWGVAQLLAKNYWPRGSRLILVHTGGLQGRRGFNRAS
jgi:1-aminocyclopropane-1-carboxylate deaminase